MQSSEQREDRARRSELGKLGELMRLVADNGQVNTSRAGVAQRLRLPRRIDPLTLLAAIVALFLAQATQPWWSITGTTTSRLFTIQGLTILLPDKPDRAIC